jgi:hypothetical protein
LLSKEGEAPLYASLNGKQGSILGNAEFREIMSTSDFDGNLSWFHPQLTSGAFKTAFNTELGLAGALYPKLRAGQRELRLVNEIGNAIFLAENGGLMSPIETLFTLNSKNVATLPITSPQALTLSFYGKTGLFAGSFIHPVTKVLTRFGGAVLRKQNLGDGYFISGANSGEVSLAPNPDKLPANDDDGSLGAAPLPVIAYKLPADGARIASPDAVTLSGTASDKQGIAAVLYKMIHGGAVSDIQLATGTTSWSIPLQIAPDDGGNFVVYAKAIDTAGNESELTARSFFYVVPKDLSVTINGIGTVTAGFAGITSREIGRTYTITAKAGLGGRFNGWSGSVVSMSPTITF